MPRNAARSGAVARRPPLLSPEKSSLRSPVKLSINDDREEKAVRFQSRQALQEIQMNSIRAAVSPSKRHSSGQNAGSPRTPSGQENGESQGLAVVNGKTVTPVKRVPILANFEEWMKMATDNKINATNSWNFALIDYFHDMSLLREGDSVNFQKASCTLDGCVKIYTSRVDSVATETGKLLSGLADNSNTNKRRGAGEEEDGEQEDDDGDEDGEGGKKRPKKRVQRSSEATLASSFAQLQLKKMELEFSVDPLFKKASADFDEGGAKGLLLNHLTVDATGRIVFDSSDDAQGSSPNNAAQDDSNQKDDEDVSENGSENDPSANSVTSTLSVPLDLGALADRFFPDLSKLDGQDVCPSLKTFELEGESQSLDIPLLKDKDEWKKNSHTNPDEPIDGFQDGAPFEEDNDGFAGGFHMDEDVAFGDGGEAWAKEAAIDTQHRPFNAGFGREDGALADDIDGVGEYDPDSEQYGVVLRHGKFQDQENILSYFDQALQKNWAGPQHWRIQKIKDINKPPAPARQRKEKEPFQIDFAAPMSKAIRDSLYTTATSNSTISLPKKEWKSKTRNLLPDDKHFNSRQLLRLFLKPKAHIGSRGLGVSSVRAQEGEMDEAFWARHQQSSANGTSEDDLPKGDYDANFFQDDGLGIPAPLDDEDDDVFADAREALSPGLEGESAPNGGSLDAALASEPQGVFGSQLVTQSRRVRPEYVQYARVAKKVDVRRLKEEMWRGLGFDKMNQGSASPTPMETDQPIPKALEEGGSLQFTDVMNNLQSVYPKEAMADISTSYCFICLLHLANEKGLTLGHNETFEEIQICKDPAGIMDGSD